MITDTQASPTPAAISPPALHTGSDRLMSLDALRGFDMFWIIGGDGLLFCLADVAGYGAKSQWLHGQFEHPNWNGFTFYDLTGIIHKNGNQRAPGCV